RLRIEEDGLTPRNVLSRISYAKNHGHSPEQLRATAFALDTRKVADIFAAYEDLLKHSKAVDFDDLLLRSAQLLRASADVRERWRARFAYVHVDEYQDTNRVQYDLVRLLANEQRNVCVVGDEDQSIYRWRGAVVSNNPDRLGKTLRAEKEKGANLRYYEARDAQAEAEFIAGEVERILGDDPDQTCAVEYRTN